jgi:hypothetical protein
LYGQGLPVRWLCRVALADHKKRPADVHSNGGSGEGDVNPDDLPDEIVQPLLQLGRALMTHAQAHRDTSAPFRTVMRQMRFT